jgi:PadR family transcriptional regulator PadR
VKQVMPKSANQDGELPKRTRAFLSSWILEMCVLAFLLHDDAYGYRVAKSIGLQISESTLYPILRRLESDGCLSVYTQQHSAKLRRFYKITPKGIARLEELKGDWTAFAVCIDRYIKEGDGNTE